MITKKWLDAFGSPSRNGVQYPVIADKSRPPSARKMVFLNTATTVVLVTDIPKDMQTENVMDYEQWEEMQLLFDNLPAAGEWTCFELRQVIHENSTRELCGMCGGSGEHVCACGDIHVCQKCGGMGNITCMNDEHVDIAGYRVRSKDLLHVFKAFPDAMLLWHPKSTVLKFMDVNMIGLMAAE